MPNWWAAARARSRLFILELTNRPHKSNQAHSRIYAAADEPRRCLFINVSRGQNGQWRASAACQTITTELCSWVMRRHPAHQQQRCTRTINKHQWLLSLIMHQHQRVVGMRARARGAAPMLITRHYAVAERAQNWRSKGETTQQKWDLGGRRWLVFLMNNEANAWDNEVDFFKYTVWSWIY